MDRDRRLDVVRDIPAEGRAGHRGRRGTRRARVLGRASEHDGLVRAQPGETAMTARRALRGCILTVYVLACSALMGVASADAPSATAVSAAAPASMAARGHRAATVGIDVVTYP